MPLLSTTDQRLDVQEGRNGSAAKDHGNHDENEQNLFAGKIPFAERVCQCAGQEHAHRHAKRQVNQRVLISADDVALIDQRFVGGKIRIFRKQREWIPQVFVLRHDGHNDGGVEREHDGNRKCRKQQEQNGIHEGKTLIVDFFYMLSGHCSHLQSGRRRPNVWKHCWR